jgi:hypothetical protein
MRVKVYLLPMADEECLFYLEGAELAGEAEVAGPERGGVRGWAERKYKSLQVVLTESERGVGLRVRRAWEWLQKRTAPDEPLLRSLRGAESIELFYPSSLSAAAVRERWADYLTSRSHRHTFWLVINSIISPLTVVLAPVPGPNVIGYWFVYRAVCHLLARLGIRRALRGEVPTELSPSGLLDGTFAAATGERIASVEAGFDLKGLGLYLERATRERGGREAARLAASETGGAVE